MARLGAVRARGVFGVKNVILNALWDELQYTDCALFTQLTVHETADRWWPSPRM